ncbi:uncharacterized protein N7482_002236 [Penicillium canariense]|uniref:MutL C-terminal dimerisation domain-containing protein n=1 Tax=Penicillium canariense TaxID=189055 RepID=A0A9W9LUM8_9EURO|nr:uncharacterized protein N7482_002236 [Penicillium canariense]KAJ5176359.1 hypothetical protein N7482_002236 [Penicillium canariense]
MSSPGTRIQALPSDVAAKIRSSTSITHLNGVIVDLIKNSLDAGAHTILISVDFKRGSCIVEDDGEGILPIEFESTGGLGKAHHTSKYQRPGVYSHRGIFLASLASLSLLTVTSRRSQHPTTNSVIFHDSKPVARLIPAPAHQGLRLGERGTCITVNDLFGNMPVRVKSRALALEKPEDLEREWDNLRYLLVSLILANAQLSKLVVSDAARGKRITLRPTSPARSRSPNLSASEMDLGRIGSILSQSGMIDSRNMDSWRVISASIPDLTIHAAISTVPSPSKKFQFISLGKHPVLSRNRTNVLFNEVNRLMSMSDFGNTGGLSDTTPASPSPMSRISDASVNVAGGKWAKPVNKWPMFYIRIETESLEHFEDSDEPSASETSIQGITDVLEAMVLEFLKQQNMRPRSSRRLQKPPDRSQKTTSTTRTSSTRSDSFTKRGRNSSTEECFSSHLKLPSLQRSRSANTGPYFHNWSRVKAAKRAESSAFGAGANGAGPISENDHFSSDEQLPFLTEHPRSRLKHSRHFVACSDQPDASQDEPVPSVGSLREIDQGEPELDLSEAFADKLMSWVDPCTGITHQINSRTGQTVHPRALSAGPRSNRFLPTFQKPDRSSEPRFSSSSSLWVDNLLDGWDNPIFARTEMSVPNLDAGLDCLHDTVLSPRCHEDVGFLDSTQIAKFRGKLRRQSLATATIIAQVDQKFILVKFRTMHAQAPAGDDSGEVLVLIDQHAADERCRVEQLFKDMFISPGSLHQWDQVHTAEIDPITFGISSTEAALFRKYSYFFGGWGIDYSLTEKGESGVTVHVNTLPTLIAERCRLEPSLIVDLLRREIWTSEEEDGKPLGSKRALRNFSFGHDFDDEEASSDRIGATAAHPWVQKMSGCPQGVLDILNSRACRGAIMFNDPLDIENCRALITRLSQCAFPFQCAHGRPSMIPILGLRPPSGSHPLFSDAGIMGSGCDENNDNGLDFLKAFRARYAD